MANFKEVPVIEVHRENFTEMWPTLMLAVKSATFVAIDAELSGLGTKKLLFAKSVDDRYKEMCDVAKSRSVISLGLSCFLLQPNQGTDSDSSSSGILTDSSCSGQKNTKTLNFQVQTFNILLLCSENYIVEPLTLKFLIEHGFDFNKQYAKGISYYRGNDRDGEKEYQTMRQLFVEITASKVPVVLHNALFDLIFMFQNFYANIPSSIQTFVADLTEVFAGGIYDTKYITEFKARMPASYLEYIFRKCQRDNHNKEVTGASHVITTFLKYPKNMLETIVFLPCALENRPEKSQDGKLIVCAGYAAFGWCSRGNMCKNSHDIDLILNNEDKLLSKTQKRRMKKQMKLKNQTSDSPADEDHERDSLQMEIENESETSVQDFVSHGKASEVQELNTKTLLKDGELEDRSYEKCPSTVRKTCGHRAGFDSFMTGFAFATFLCRFGGYSSSNQPTKLADFNIEDLRNKVTLSGKDIPLLIQKGNFAKNSKDHKLKMEKHFESKDK